MAKPRSTDFKDPLYEKSDTPNLARKIAGLYRGRMQVYELREDGTFVDVTPPKIELTPEELEWQRAEDRTIAKLNAEREKRLEKEHAAMFRYQRQRYKGAGSNG